MSKFHFKDIICLTYLFLVLIFILLFRNNISEWEIHTLRHVLLIGGIIFITKFKIHKERKLWLFSQIFYPVAIIIFSWIELKPLGQMIPFRQDLTLFIIKGEAFIFGFENLKSLHRSFCFCLDEFMSFLYLSYYLILPLVTIPLFFRKKIDFTEAIIFLVTLTYLSNFLFFYFFPSLSPNYLNFWEIESKKSSRGGLFARLIDFIQTKEGVRGAAFPSSHLSAVTCLTLASWIYWNKLVAIFLSFLGPLIGFSAIYLGYHHVLDCLAGIIWGGLSFLVGLKLLKIKK